MHHDTLIFLPAPNHIEPLNIITLKITFQINAMHKYSTEHYNYNLPQNLIAQTPAAQRDKARLMVIDRSQKTILHDNFCSLVNYLKPGDCLVLNNSRVLPARLFGTKLTGGKLEVFLLKPLTQTQQTITWQCLVGGRGATDNLVITLTSKLSGKLIKNNQDGTWNVQFNLPKTQFIKLVGKIGIAPLPPYIKRADKQSVSADKHRYQTVFAHKNKFGSVAAPTAGLHFTKKLLAQIKKRGIKIAHVTLHVGLGTFAPVKTEDIRKHKMHPEYAEISLKNIQTILNTKKSGGRIVAVGTTSARVLEGLVAPNLKTLQKTPRKLSGDINIFIYPGFKFQLTDALVTNFHLPKSTLLMFVSALAEKKLIDRAYQEAIQNKYRFFSYGDAMFIQ